MFINYKGSICFISKVEKPYRIWYGINLEIPIYGDDYVVEKLGVTDPIKIKELQDAFLDALTRVPQKSSELVESHTVRYDKYVWTFYLANKSKKSVTIFLKKNPSPKVIKTTGRHPLGCSWATIERTDTPEDLIRKLYSTEKQFFKALHKKLWKVMNW
jgi:hypothetical protein